MTHRVKRVAIVGGGVSTVQCALTLAELGLDVVVVTPFMELGTNSATDGIHGADSLDLLRIRPILLKAASHPQIKFHTNSNVHSVVGRPGEFTLRATKHPRYVNPYLCTSCGRCAEACSVKVAFGHEGQIRFRNAIHAPLLGVDAVPSSYSIDKKGLPPCKAACPLGINVQGFVSLLSIGKCDEALRLINESAPLAGVLGRVCTHPCEDNCKRVEVDDPVFIKALHRYAADNASEDIQYTRKAPAGSRREKIAIVGSGPAGLTAAWELARRGYSPMVFEEHAVIGGMLATGIPRFRLPREVREREVKAIEALGVQMRTGITIGRDVTLSDLRERGYRALFLAIGAHKNNRLGIPGEYLEGVVDSISLLFELNLMVGASVGHNLIVIGGGNSAVDSARTARRRGKRNVTIQYRRTAEEMTAVKEDLEEALNEGILIEYLTSPVEILGDGVKVTGIRCQRMGLGEVGADGRRKPVPIEGSEFTMVADHVVVAIGQQPNIEQLKARGVALSDSNNTYQVDPLTLETSVPGIFAGGDCVTGPNSVVEAVAAGLQAAESMDRYLRGLSLRRGRSLEKSKPIDIDVNERYISPYDRATMPLIPRYKRMSTFEETCIGIPPETAEREALRCLNCAVCSGCLECNYTCELGAVFHDDSCEEIEVEADIIVDFASAGANTNTQLADHKSGQPDSFSLAIPGIYTVQTGSQFNLWEEIAQASSLALEVASRLLLREEVIDRCMPEGEHAGNICKAKETKAPHVRKEKSRIGVFLCSCGSSNSAVIDFAKVSNWVQSLPGVHVVEEMPQACTQEGALQIMACVTKENLDGVVLAACRCCNLNQICFSCNDRRVMCKYFMDRELTLPDGMVPEFVNIREQCAWACKGYPEMATQRAVEAVTAGIARDMDSFSEKAEVYSVHQKALVVGTGLSGLVVANSLSAQGYSVTLLSGPNSDTNNGCLSPELIENRNNLLAQLKSNGVRVKPWPDSLELRRVPGNYEVSLNYGSEIACIDVGSVILNVGEMEGELSSKQDNISEQWLLGRILSHHNCWGANKDNVDQYSIRELTIGETSGIFVVSSDNATSFEEQIMRGSVIAARAWAYLTQGTLSSRPNAVIIDRKLCRGCGDCIAICPYMEMIDSGSAGIFYAYVDRTLCLGCGACISHCPTGAIRQPLQGDEQIISMMEALLTCSEVASEVG